MRRALAIGAVNVLGVLLLLAALEGVARLAGGGTPEPLFDEPRRFLRDRAFVMPHPRRGFALRPGSESGPYRINRDGFRGPELPDRARSDGLILAVGDSTTFGWQVGDAESWPRQLEARLREGGAGWTVVNAGVPSYTSAQTRLYLEELLPRLRPDRVLVSVLWNDVWYSTLDPWFPEALVRGQPSAWRSFLYRHSALFRWLSRADAPERDADVLNRAALAHYAENLEAMARLAREHGAPLAFLMPPLDLDHVEESARPQLSPIGRGAFTKTFILEVGRLYVAAMAQVAESHGTLVIDHRVSIRHPHQPRLFLDFIHPRPRGHRLLAEDVARALALEMDETPRP